MRRFPIFFIIFGLLVGFAGPWTYFNVDPASWRQTEQPRRGGRRAPAAEEVVPVLASQVAVRDVPVHRDGIGNVQAYNSIVVRAQVDGRLLSIDFQEGQDVKKGDLIARIDPAIYQAQYDQARAKKAQDEANLANARIDLERYERLAATNAGSKQQADSQKAMVAQLEAQIRADQAAIDNAKAVLDYTTIRAPIDGRLGLRQIDAGSIARSSDANGIVGIAQVKPISVLFTLPQRDFASVREAMGRGAVRVEAMESDGRTVIAQGALEVVDNQIDTATGTFKLKATFPNEDLRLWPGQFVTARVQVATLTSAMVVPTPAIRRGPDGTFVYLVNDEKAVVRPVRVTQQDEDNAVVAEGLRPGQQVVTSSFARLSDGKPISISDPQAPVAVDAPPRVQPPDGRGQRGRGQARGQGQGRGQGGGNAAPRGAGDPPPAAAPATPPAPQRS